MQTMEEVFIPSVCVREVSLSTRPGAKIAASVLISSLSLMISPVNFPSWITKSVTFASKRTSPPRDLISSLIPATTFLKRSVPICGLFSYKISSGAPCSTKVSKTNLFLPNLSFTMVFSFPSENVPAPPSPNCTLDYIRSS